VAVLYNVFNIIKCITSAYQVNGECRRAHLPVGRGERWDITGTEQFSIAARGAGTSLLELVLVLRRYLLSAGRGLVQEAAVEI